jgi:ribonucleotide reductase alpha subunit
VRFLDDVIDISNYPLDAQTQEAKAKRRIGLGVTGLADALILAGVRYGTPEAVALAESWMAAIEHAAYRASAELAREKGAFPLYDAERFLAAPSSAAPARGGAGRHRPPRHAQRPRHVDCPHRHDLASGRQRFQRHRAGVRFPLRAPRARARRHHAHRVRRGLRACASIARLSAPRRR